MKKLASIKEVLKAFNISRTTFYRIHLTYKNMPFVTCGKRNRYNIEEIRPFIEKYQSIKAKKEEA